MMFFRRSGRAVMLAAAVAAVCLVAGCAKKAGQETAPKIPDIPPANNDDGVMAKASDDSVPYDYHKDDYDLEDDRKRFSAAAIAAAEAKAAAFPDQIFEINQEAERWLKTFNIDDMGHVTGNAYNPLDGVYFSFDEFKEKDTGIETEYKYDYYTWTATSKAEFGDCPAGSAWSICVGIDDDWSAYRCGLESVKEACRFIQIAPKVIRQPKEFFKTQPDKEPR